MVPFPGADAGLPSSQLYLTAGTRDSWTLDRKEASEYFSSVYFSSQTDFCSATPSG